MLQRVLISLHSIHRRKKEEKMDFWSFEGLCDDEIGRSVETGTSKK